MFSRGNELCAYPSVQTEYGKCISKREKKEFVSQKNQVNPQILTDISVPLMRSSTTLVRALRERFLLIPRTGSNPFFTLTIRKINNTNFFSAQIKILLRLKITSKQNQFIGVGGIVCIDKPPQSNKDLNRIRNQIVKTSGSSCSKGGGGEGVSNG